MMPSLSSSSSISTTIKVDKATSELLIGPDWTINMEICDLCNSNRWKTKDVVKGVKRRLQHKNPRVQLLTLTLLEAMVKNCGEYIHHQIAERKILDEMIKIVKKKEDIHVKDKILILVDSWQETFGGPGKKYSQYYWACDELRRFGARFPQRPQKSASVTTPPATSQPKVLQIGYGGSQAGSSQQRLEQALTSEVEGLSLSTLESMRNVSELLDDMLQAVNPNDRMAVKDEIIVDLVDHCRTNQKKLMQMITTTTDENLLAQGLKMNDFLQSVLAMNDAISSGMPLPNHGKRINTPQKELPNPNTKSSNVEDKHPSDNNGKSPISVEEAAKDKAEEDNDYPLLAERNSKTRSGPSQIGPTDDGASSSGSNNVLALIDFLAAETTTTITTTNTSKEQDLIDLLSIVLTTGSSSETSHTPSSTPAQSTLETSIDNYVVPWAQAQPQPKPQPQHGTQSFPQLQNQYQPMQPQTQQTYPQYPSSTFPPPPSDPTSNYINNGSNPYMYSNYQGSFNNPSMATMQGGWSSSYLQYYGNQQQMYSNYNHGSLQANRSLEHSNSFQNPPSMNNVNHFSANSSNSGNSEKPYVPSYRLFEDLNILGNSNANKLKNGSYRIASRNPNPNPSPNSNPKPNMNLL